MKLAILVLALVACGPAGRPGDDDVIADDDAPPSDAPPVVCSPGHATCEGTISHVCTNDGAGFVDTDCDPVMGMACDGDTGQCTGTCAPGNLGSSYIGCEYFPTVVGNTVGTQFSYAVAISNTSAADAAITIDGGALANPLTLTVPAGRATARGLPWPTLLK